jgi:hypothetical protein
MALRVVGRAAEPASVRESGGAEVGRESGGSEETGPEETVAVVRTDKAVPVPLASYQAEIGIELVT